MKTAQATPATGSSTPGTQRRRKPPAPEYRRLTLNVTEAVHERMQELADARSIPVTELLRRAFVTFRALDELLREYPNARIVIQEESSGSTHPVPTLPLGDDVW